MRFFKKSSKYISPKDVHEVTIPNDATEIGEYVYANNLSLSKVTIPSSVKEICKCAFLGCSSLKNITIPNSVTKIGDNAFSGCSSLTKAYVPSIFKNIKNVFPENCKLEEQTFNNQNIIDNF